MERWPFTREEWDTIDEAARHIVNASFLDDEILRDSAYAALVEHLEQLRSAHGDHPVLLETLADFCDDPLEQLALYREAIQIALDHDFQTLTIRLSLANVLIEDLHDHHAARRELDACTNEAATTDDASDREKWQELHAKLRSSTQPDMHHSKNE
jgi:hypothetical protein